MSKLGKRFFSLLCVLCLFCAVGCASPDRTSGGDKVPDFTAQALWGDEFSCFTERGFSLASEVPDSAFSLSASRSAYPYMRRAVRAGRLPDASAVRIEEYINYFDYEIEAPAEGEFAAVSAVGDCPWNEDAKLLRLTLRAKEVPHVSAANNLVFLVDVSASMYGDDRLGLFNAAMQYVTAGLSARDTVSLVTYAGHTRVLLDGVNAARRDEILSAVDGLQAGGNTAGADAIRMAYAAARKHFVAGGNNRIVLFTDGDFNVGTRDTDELRDLVQAECEGGIFLTCVGVGYGNYKDTVLEALSVAGNGETFYLDSREEARRVFGENLTGALFTVATDCKAQLSFDAAQVERYRLIGYDNRLLTGVQFEDAATDAGELGAGRQITVLYEIVPAATCDETKDAATAELRYKLPQDGIEKRLVIPVGFGGTTDDDAFIACVAEYGLLLRRSSYAPQADMAKLLSRLSALTLAQEKEEFRALVATAANLT